MTITFIAEIQIFKRFHNTNPNNFKFWQILDACYVWPTSRPCALQLYLGLGLWAFQIPALEHDSQTTESPGLSTGYGQSPQ